MEFECPECDWGLIGGDETGVSITSPHGFHDYGTPPASECRFRYCFHCGVKIPESDSLEKLRDDLEKYADAVEADAPDGKDGDSLRGAAYLLSSGASRLTALIERGA